MRRKVKAHMSGAKGAVLSVRKFLTVGTAR